MMLEPMDKRKLAMSKPLHQISDDGSNAAMAGQPRNSNPYDKNNELTEWERWDKGWLSGENDRKTLQQIG